MNSSSQIPKQWAWHHRALQRIRESLLEERAEHTRAVRIPLEHGGEDFSDVASERTERDTLLAEIRTDEAELAEVEAALERIRKGTYGLCEVTGRRISAARLRAIPWTRVSQEVAQTAAKSAG